MRPRDLIVFVRSAWVGGMAISNNSFGYATRTGNSSVSISARDRPGQVQSIIRRGSL